MARPLPIIPDIEAEAARNPDGWVYTVDWEYRPEAIEGAFEVDEYGKLTGQFRPNPHYTGDIKT